jgi:hypothetical protein
VLITEPYPVVSYLMESTANVSPSLLERDLCGSWTLLRTEPWRSRFGRPIRTAAIWKTLRPSRFHRVAHPRHRHQRTGYDRPSSRHVFGESALHGTGRYWYCDHRKTKGLNSRNLASLSFKKQHKDSAPCTPSPPMSPRSWRNIAIALIGGDPWSRTDDLKLASHRGAQ